MATQSKRHQSAVTAQKLLDTAERLFGEHGYNGVGMRALAQAAKVNLAATTYHFGSKKVLYVETFLRRFRRVNARRTELLAAADREADGQPLPVERIVECMMRPPMEIGLEHPAFNKLLARTLLAPPKFLHQQLQAELEPNLQLFIAALERALPEVPTAVLNLRLALALGAVLMFGVQMSAFKVKREARREAAFLKELVRFTASGLASAPATLGAELARLRPPPHRKRTA
ncbi:MAG TPA: TetR/AcrR family transcriptional regulator [Steroidobacteraceae bacterium]|nr:TetR/AcrR family transcriptional regulator [Steroidobacteraceae bacterium]